MEETIYALASAAGRGGVAVIRVSGPAVLTGLKTLCDFSKEIIPRYANFRTINDPVSRETIDTGLVIYFKGPSSFTGDDVAEYHIHGGRATTEKLLSVLGGLDGYRMAEPGEFTRRAFVNGKIDLTQAEAVADLVDAETEFQRRQALHQAGGALYRLYDGWREELVHILAYVEAHLDFPDEEDVPDTLNETTKTSLKRLSEEIEVHLADNRRGERLRDGIKIAIIGAPNTGKSSLLNLLARREAAIVSEIEGTTRDVLEVPLDLGGYAVLLIDTAGLRPDRLDGSDQSKIEGEGIRRAMKAAREADFKILLFSADDLPDLDPHTLNLKDENSLMVINKSDLMQEQAYPQDFLPISVSQDKNIPELLQALTKEISRRYGYQDKPALTRERHRLALTKCLDALKAAQKEAVLELAAENLRQAATHLGRITGKIDVEQLLDVIFRDFCIGK